jgi:hypothetical protein
MLMRRVIQTLAYAMLLTTGIMCAQAADLHRGMTRDEVIKLLGPPDRRGVLEGKVIRQLTDSMALEHAESRVVYFYDKTGIQVWLLGGKVTGATKNGVSIL